MKVKYIFENVCRKKIYSRQTKSPVEDMFNKIHELMKKYDQVGIIVEGIKK